MRFMEPRKDGNTRVINIKQGWEYTTMELGRHVTDRQVNNLGQQGWELVAIVNGNTGYFKRPL